eukprot:m.48087 g.48087  ORF g.48087 m.48087 type:complete len:183 (+) comp47661_c0_seq1:22-570(+)
MWGVFAAIGRFWSRLLYSLGLASKNAAIVLLGLDNAGKTTLLYRLRTGEMHSFLPTQRAQQQQLQIGQLRLNAWDVGGHERVRALWQTYAIQANAIIFLIDSADRARLGQCPLRGTRVGLAHAVFLCQRKREMSCWLCCRPTATFQSQSLLLCLQTNRTCRNPFPTPRLLDFSSWTSTFRAK